MNNNLNELILSLPKNQVILDNFIIAYSKINSPLYENIICSISGGADSDIILDICYKCDKDKKIKYIWFNTGLEYQATKDHIKYLEQKYSINIIEYKPIKSIPNCCKELGQPFLSKQVSEWISRLQRHGFKWEDEPYELLVEKYQGCSAALKWWCNKWSKQINNAESKFNIGYNKYLKEFMVQNPPDFLINNKCCVFAKKLVATRAKIDYQCDLSITGVRKAEGGARSSAFKNCFTENCGKADEYRPIFWYKDEDKEEYEKHFDIIHSDCYTKYGLDRTGCTGCPFGKYFEDEIKVIEKYEPKFYNVVNNVFGKSYEYTRKYQEFCKSQKNNLKK